MLPIFRLGELEFSKTDSGSLMASVTPVVSSMIEIEGPQLANKRNVVDGHT